MKSLLLYSICQRYNFESNLQQEVDLSDRESAVFDMSKIQFWKQFTTNGRKESWASKLYSICQRYNFESNLQPKEVEAYERISCIRYVKDTILKAIYNRAEPILAKDWLYSICQRYNFESNLQRRTSTPKVSSCCIRYVKDTILKAIYNENFVYMFLLRAVFDMSKIQFWKQFTTYHCAFGKLSSLYSICQRYNFESNLQPEFDNIGMETGCIRYVKDTILKAIYNWRWNMCL